MVFTKYQIENKLFCDKLLFTITQHACYIDVAHFSSAGLMGAYVI